jgi:hypothetical protein
MWSMIPKSGHRFSQKIMLKQEAAQVPRVVDVDALVYRNVRMCLRRHPVGDGMAEGMRNADAQVGGPRRRRGGSRILAGIGAAVVVLAAAAYANDESLQLRVEREVEARFAAIRTTLGPATHGRVQFDPWTRTIRIHDIALQPNRNVMPPMKIGELALVGMPLPAGERITAWRVELTGTELAVDAFNAIRIDGLVIDDLDVSRAIDWQGLRDLAEAGSGPLRSVPQPQDVLPVVADAVEGIRFGRLEMRGLGFREGAKGVDVASVRVDGLVGGRFKELTVRGVSSIALPDKVSLGRVALKKLDLAGMLRNAAHLGPANRPPTPDEIAALLNGLEGIEMDDAVLPDQRLGHTAGDAIRILSLQVAWGPIVGTLPTSAHYAVKAEMPIADQDGPPFKALRDAGIGRLTVALDIGSAWNEQTRTLVLSPATVELNDLLAVSLKLSIGNFSPDLLLDDPVKKELAAKALEVGALEVSVHDNGAVEFAASQVARNQAISAGDARAKMIEDMKRAARTQPRQDAELGRLVDALGRFLAKDGETLRIAVRPKGRVNLAQMFELDPSDALSQFNVEASVGGP